MTVSRLALKTKKYYYLKLPTVSAMNSCVRNILLTTLDGSKYTERVSPLLYTFTSAKNYGFLYAHRHAMSHCTPGQINTIPF